MYTCKDCGKNPTKEEEEKYQWIKSVFRPFVCKKCYRLRKSKENGHTR